MPSSIDVLRRNCTQIFLRALTNATEPSNDFVVPVQQVEVGSHFAEEFTAQARKPLHFARNDPGITPLMRGRPRDRFELRRSA